MKDVINLVQTTLDTILSASGIRSYWGRRADDSNANQTEYIIYDLNGDPVEVSADGDVMLRKMGISLQYYVKFSVARTYNGRQNAFDRMDEIREAMRDAGFGCPDGWFEIGDVDEIGFATFRSEYEIPRDMGGA